MGKLKDLTKKIQRLETSIQKNTQKLSKLKSKADTARQAKAAKVKSKPASASGKATKAPETSGAAASPTKKRSNLTPEGRAKLSAAAKARWAAKKAASVETTSTPSATT